MQSCTLCCIWCCRCILHRAMLIIGQTFRWLPETLAAKSSPRSNSCLILLSFNAENSFHWPHCKQDVTDFKLVENHSIDIWHTTFFSRVFGINSAKCGSCVCISRTDLHWRKTFVPALHNYNFPPFSWYFCYILEHFFETGSNTTQKSLIFRYESFQWDGKWQW